VQRGGSGLQRTNIVNRTYQSTNGGEDFLRVLSGNANIALADEICAHLNTNRAHALVGRFKNQEIRVRIEENVRGMDVFIVQTLCNPVSDHLMELLIMIDAVRRASADRITAVVPYFAYAKQEKKTAGREPISAKLVANLITTAGADRVLTMDLHAAAIEGFFDIPVDHLRAAPILAQYFMDKKLEDVVVVSPDAGGVGRANDFRERIGASLAIISKQRPRPDVAEVIEMVGDVQGKNAIMVDDMISTGGTLVEAAKVLFDRGAKAVYATATHPVFAGEAIDLIDKSDMKEVVVTNTVPVLEEHHNDKIVVLSVAKLFADTIYRIHNKMSVSALFT